MPRTIRRLPAFERDYRREKRGQRGGRLEAELRAVLTCCLTINRCQRATAITRYVADHRDCRIRPDLILIYRKPDDDRLELVLLGSHSELFG